MKNEEKDDSGSESYDLNLNHDTGQMDFFTPVFTYQTNFAYSSSRTLLFFIVWITLSKL